MKTYDYNDIEKGTVVPTAYDTLQTADYDETHGIPAIHFTWRTLFRVEIPAEEVEAFETAWPGLAEEAYDDKSRKVCWCARTEGATHHAWLMNFRRYWWCWSPEPAGKYGYGGPCYANGDDGGIYSRSEEETIRQTLIAALAQGRVPDTLLRHVSVRPLIQRLLDDAMAHVSPHASTPIGRTNGAVGTIRVNGLWAFGM